MNCNCPQCGSDQTQPFRMVYESGTSAGVHHTLGVGLSSGGAIGIGGAQTASTSMTELAAKVAPPEKIGISIIIWLLLAAVGYYAIAGPANAGAAKLTVGLFIGIPCIRTVFRAVKFNTRDYPALMEQWEKSWLCRRCGNSFTLQ